MSACLCKPRTTERHPAIVSGLNQLGWTQGTAVEGSDEPPRRQRVPVGPGPVKGWGGPSSAGAGHGARDAVIAHRSGVQSNDRPGNEPQLWEDRVELLLPRPCPR